MTEWTPAQVEERLRQAIALKASLSNPDLRPGGGGIGGIGGEGEPDGVAAMAAGAMSWLGWLDPEAADIVLARLEGARWKLICWRFGISRPTADRRFRYALAVIAWRLNGHAASAPVPSFRSVLNPARHDP